MLGDELQMTRSKSQAHLRDTVVHVHVECRAENKPHIRAFRWPKYNCIVRDAYGPGATYQD